jgi:hypothetical protein
MSVKVFDTKEAQDLLKAAANLGSQDGNARGKQIVHRLLSDLFKAIDDLDMTPDEIWAGVHYFNKLGQDGEAALLAAGLGLEKYLDIRMDAEDKEADIGGTPRTIEGPLYVAGAPVRDGVSRIDINPDQDAGPLVIRGTVTGPDGKPVAGCGSRMLAREFKRLLFALRPDRRAERVQSARCGQNWRRRQVRIPYADAGGLRLPAAGRDPATVERARPPWRPSGACALLCHQR